MAKSPYLPSTDADFLVWLNRFNANIARQQATFGLSAEDIAGVAADNRYLNAKFQAADQATAVAKQATADKTAGRRNADAHVRALVRRIKAHSAYTESLGLLLGVEGPEDTTDLSLAKPDLTARDFGGGKVELAFPKSSSHGVNLYGQRDGEADFTFLARDTASTYVDTRPPLVAGKPELRRNKAVYVLNDEEIGQFSDEVRVNCVL